MTQDNQRSTRMHASEAFMLFAGCTLPPGDYELLRSAHSSSAGAGDKETYNLRLTVEQLRVLGQAMSKLDEPLLLDVTNHVSSGRFAPA